MSAVPELPDLSLRAMTRDDLTAIAEIEQRAYQYPWSRGILDDCLRVGYSCWVCEIGDKIQAYAIMSAAAGESHVMNLTVDPRAQGRGIGRAVLRQLIEMARQQRADTMLLEVRQSNTAALKLYVSEGFNEVGTRRAYYPAKWGREDAIILARALH